MVTTLIMVQSVSTMLVPSEVQYIGLKPWRIYAVLQSSKGVAIELHINTSIPLCVLASFQRLNFSYTSGSALDTISLYTVVLT